LGAERGGGGRKLGGEGNCVCEGCRKVEVRDFSPLGNNEQLGAINMAQGWRFRKKKRIVDIGRKSRPRRLSGKERNILGMLEKGKIFAGRVEVKSYMKKEKRGILESSRRKRGRGSGLLDEPKQKRVVASRRKKSLL